MNINDNTATRNGRKASRTTPPAKVIATAALSPSPPDEEAKLLAEMEKKVQVVRDYTVGVIEGLFTGLYVYGPGGTSKSYTVIDVLRQRHAHDVLHNSRLTGQTLYAAMAEAPDAVHLIEDVEGLFRQPNALGVIRSALWGQRADGNRGPMERWVTWGVTGRQPRELKLLFTGGLIMTANRSLGEHVPEWQAIMTRIAYVQFAPTDGEIRALMRCLARRGCEIEGRRMSPEESCEVVEFLIAQSAHLQRRLDLRLLENCYGDYLLWKAGLAGCHWHDLVATRLRQRPTYFRHEVATGPEGLRRARKEVLDIVRQVRDATTNPEERVRLWAEQTNQSRATFYRRLADLRNLGEADPADAAGEF
jgi:hypothetical protein